MTTFGSGFFPTRRIPCATRASTYPPGLKVKVVENTADLIHIVLPAKRVSMADEALEKVTAGTEGFQLVFDLERPCGNYSCPAKYFSKECWEAQSFNGGWCNYLNLNPSERKFPPFAR